MKITYNIIISAMCLIGFSACSSIKKATNTAVWMEHEVECLGIGLDGTQQMKVYSRSANRSEAIEKALKNAVYTVTFKGVLGGECNSRPIIIEANAEQKYEDYFNVFFATGGEYRKYVKLSNNSNAGTITGKSGGQTLYGIQVEVDRAALRKRYESDNVIVKQ